MENEVLKEKLNFLGINYKYQLENEDIEYWWLLKYTNLKQKGNYEGLIQLNKFKDELTGYTKEDLIKNLKFSINNGNQTNYKKDNNSSKNNNYDDYIYSVL